MGVFFSGKELLDVAIGIERNGAAFYDSLVDSTRDGTVQSIYKHLADKEREHIKIFQNMLGSVSDYQLPETYTEEYDSYLKTLIDSFVFTNDQVAHDMARKVSVNSNPK